MNRIENKLITVLTTKDNKVICNFGTKYNLNINQILS